MLYFIPFFYMFNNLFAITIKNNFENLNTVDLIKNQPAFNL